MKNFLVSVIIPVYNEEKTVSPLLKRLFPTLKPYNHEILFVDDGSTDNTATEVKKFAQKNTAIKLVCFNRNFGHQMALSCGYELAKGDCVVSMDSDLQDPPEIIPKLIEKWQKGNKVVYAKREKREVDGVFKRITAQWFYTLINFLSDIPIPRDVGDFRLLDREVVDFLNHLSERSRFFRGLVAWGSHPAAFVLYKREKRFAGETHYTVSKMMNFALDGIASFSTKPLRLASILGFVSATIGFLGIIYAILGRIFLPTYWVTGWTGLFVGIMFLGGVQLFAIGIIGEYIGRVYMEVQKRPQYLVKETVNV